MPAIGNEPVDDVGFIRQMIDDLIARKIADPKRIYVTGMSRGGLMSFTVACALAHRHDDDPKRVIVVTWTRCTTKEPLVLYRVRGGGHRVPSLDNSPDRSGKYGLRNRDFDTIETVWAFFKLHAF